MKELNYVPIQRRLNLYYINPVKGGVERNPFYGEDNMGIRVDTDFLSKLNSDEIYQFMQTAAILLYGYFDNYCTNTNKETVEILKLGRINFLGKSNKEAYKESSKQGKEDLYNRICTFNKAFANRNVEFLYDGVKAKELQFLVEIGYRNEDAVKSLLLEDRSRFIYSKTFGLASFIEVRELKSMSGAIIAIVGTYMKCDIEKLKDFVLKNQYEIIMFILLVNMVKKRGRNLLDYNNCKNIIGFNFEVEEALGTMLINNTLRCKDMIYDYKILDDSTIRITLKGLH